MSEQSLVQATETQMVKRIEGARWLAELKPQDRQSLAHLAVRYGLDPLMKELTIYEGSPYIPVAGLIRIAHRQKMFAGLEDRPMTGEERTQYGYKAPFCWIVKAYRKDWKCPAVGTGTADPAQPFRNNPIERTRPEWMARSRAIRQALKLAFPHSLPFEEVETAEEMGIDPETGEIIDSTAVEVAPDVVEAEAVEIEPEPTDFAAEPADDDPRTDMRRQIAELAETRLLSNKQIDKWCLEHYQTDFAGTSLDGLLALKDKLAAMPEKKAS